MKEAILNFLGSTGIAKLFQESGWVRYIIMYVIIGVLLYLAIVKKFEPLLLLPIAFGMLLANLPGANLMHMDMFFDEYYVEKYILPIIGEDNIKLLGNELLNIANLSQSIKDDITIVLSKKTFILGNNLFETIAID